MTDEVPKFRRTTIITDPVYQVMDLGSDPRDRQAFRDVVDTRVFQRLRRISQLGLASYVFPGATHSRFSHSLGVYYLAYTVLRHLSEASSEEAEEIIAWRLSLSSAAYSTMLGMDRFRILLSMFLNQSTKSTIRRFMKTGLPRL